MLIHLGVVDVAGVLKHAGFRAKSPSCHAHCQHCFEMLGHGWGDAQAEFPFKRFVEANVRGGQHFGMLGDSVAHDHG